MKKRTKRKTEFMKLVQYAIIHEV